MKAGNEVEFAKEEWEVVKRCAVRDGQRDSALAAHTNYWNQFPGSYDYARFRDGFFKGWDDMYMFFLSSLAPDGQTRTSISEIRFKGAWALRRTSDHGKTYWEFEHGFSQGMDAARADFATNYC